MITFMESKEKSKGTVKCLDSQLWHACAGSMVQMPPVNSKVFYFPQGHLEHASGNLDFVNCPRFPSYIPCRVSEIKFMADPETDEVFAKIRLAPITGNDVDSGHNNNNGVAVNSDIAPDNQEKPTSFAKTLTQSDANNGGGFSVPRYCAETIFPRLDYSADPPVQTILAKDAHGKIWKFRHIYRGTPRRHLLTTGWSTFVNHKKLVAGDSIVFLRAENGDLCVGIRRAKRGIGGGPEFPSGWGPTGGGNTYGGFPAFYDEGKFGRNGNSNNGSLMSKERVKVEAVIEAASLAANGKAFEAVYYPRASTPEFCVRASLVKASLQIHWCSGMRFKMAFETEDSSRISWFMGTISAVQVADPVRWPDSPWRLLQVRWDEPDLLQNVKRVSPWLVELVSNMPSVHLSPFSPPPHKKLRLPQPPDFPLDSHLLPPFSGNHHHHLLNSNNNHPFVCLSDNAHPAGMQGARHARYGLSLSDPHLSKLHHSTFFPLGFLSPSHRPTPTPKPAGSNDDAVSCLLTMGSSMQEPKKPNTEKPAQFVLFGKPILTEKQISLSCSSDKIGNASDGSGSTLNQDDLPERSSCEGFQSELSSHCKVFMETEDVGRTLDLSLLGSYEELYEKLASLFGIEISDILNHVLYRDSTGAIRQLGEEPYSDFMKTARRLTVTADSGSDSVGV